MGSSPWISSTDSHVAPAPEVLEVPLEDLDGDRVGLRVGGHLEQQALLHVPGRHAARVESLHQPERRLHDRERGPGALGDLGEIGPEVSILVQVPDDGLGDAQGDRIAGGVPELLDQVVGEGQRVVPGEVLEGQVLAVLHGDGSALVGLIEDGRAQVERQLVDALAVHRGRLLGHGLARRRRRRDVGGRRRALGVGDLYRDFLEKGVLLEFLPDDLLQLQRGQLQELDGLLEEGRHHDALGLPEGEFHRSGA